jgi:DNA-binding winged helix-turn-helix (wHTH) protein
MIPRVAGSLRFGDFELDVAAFALRRDGVQVRLEKIPLEVLVLLVEHAGRLVTRQSIHAVLWGPDVFLDRDAAINTAMRKIRRALGDDVDQPRFVETIVGKGYRFVGQLVPETMGPQRQAAVYRLMRGAHAFALHNGENVIGRDPDVHVFLDHLSVSRRHARISITAGRAILEDLNSRNGTCVDGHGITAPTEVHDGTIIALGPITLTLVSLAGAASTRPMSGSAAPPDAGRP